MIQIHWLPGLFVLGTLLGLSFAVPDEKRRAEAVGSLAELSPAARAAFEDLDGFLPMNPPGPHDWLANHPEPGQTFPQYLRSNFLRPDQTRRFIYLAPIGSFENEAGLTLEALAEFAGVFFSMQSKVLEPEPADDKAIRSRINRFTHKRQLFAPDILKVLKRRLPPDAFCVLGVTMEDLYPDPEWNFVFGLASLSERVGVFSFARYDPKFFGEPREPKWRVNMLRRTLQVLSHETGHMFGIQHCIYYQCGMNGSNHLAESDSRPIHLCPVCLRKLQHNVLFDIVARYRALERFYRKAGLIPEADWVVRRLSRIISDSNQPKK